MVWEGHWQGPFFVLKYKTQSRALEPAKWSTMAAGSVVQLVLCNLRYFDTQVFALGGEII